MGMRSLRVLPPVMGAALALSLASLSTAPGAAAAVPAEGPGATSAASNITASAAALPGATIPAFDFRFVAGEGSAPLVTRPGFLALTASLGLKCGFQGVWTDYSAATLANLRRPYLLKKKVPPKFTFNVVASVGCEPVPNMTGSGSVKFLVSGKQFATKALSWRIAPGARPGLPLVKFPSNSSFAVFNALKLKIAKTPGGVPVATSPAGRADCRMVAGWWGYGTDAFPASPRVAYRTPASGWFAVACKPTSNAASWVAITPGSGAAARAISWGVFTPYAPAPAPIPAFSLTFNDAPANAAKHLSLRVTQPPPATAPGGVSASTYFKMGLAAFFITSTRVDVREGAGGIVAVKAMVGGTLVNPGEGRAKVDLMYADPDRPGELPREVASKDISWNLPAKDEPSGPGTDKPPMPAPVLPEVEVPVPAAWVRPDVSLDRVVLVKDEGQGIDSGKVVGDCKVVSRENDVEWGDGEKSSGVGAECRQWGLDDGAKVHVEVERPRGVPPTPIDPTLNARGDSFEVSDWNPPVVVPKDKENLGQANWWRFTVPQAWTAPDAQPVKFPTTKPIDVWVNCPALTDQECLNESQRVQMAVGQIVEAQGPNLVFAGITDSKFVPHQVAPGQGHTDPKLPGAITVTFTKPGVMEGTPPNRRLAPGQLALGFTDIFDGFTGAEAGVGGFDWIKDSAASPARIAAGYVAIDSTKLAGKSKPERQVLYMHELGHSIGLTHPDKARTLPVNGPDGKPLVQPALPSKGQVMDSSLDVPAPRWGNGDLQGLRLVGRG